MYAINAINAINTINAINAMQADQSSQRVIPTDPLERCLSDAMFKSNIPVIACVLECSKPLDSKASIRDLVFQLIRMVQQNQAFPGRDHLADIVDQFVLDELTEAGRVSGDDVAR